jgi:hypothetical protein
MSATLKTSNLTSVQMKDVSFGLPFACSVRLTEWQESTRTVLCGSGMKRGRASPACIYCNRAKNVDISKWPRITEACEKILRVKELLDAETEQCKSQKYQNKNTEFLFQFWDHLFWIYLDMKLHISFKMMWNAYKIFGRKIWKEETTRKT